MTVRALHRGLRDHASGERVALAGSEARHLARVLRVRRADVVVIFDGQGWEAEGRVAEVRTGRADEVLIELVVSPRAGVGADRAGVVWLQGVPKADKLERITRQAAELGARALWPVVTERSVARGPAASRTERLREIAVSASAQCGRADLLEVREPVALSDALLALPGDVELRFVAWERATAPVTRAVSPSAAAGACAVLVGPEGGLADEEVALAEAAGFKTVSLGPRIWRTETVAPALLAILSALRGDLRG
jgi:16S rRNA (uracil1498-N3)-methyltransferase